MMVKMLARYSRNGASSRLRFLQYRAELQTAGIESEFSPLFSENYLDKLYSGRNTFVSAFRSYFGRGSELLSRSANDLLWIQSESLPWLPWAIEAGLLPRQVPRVVDCDDAIFHRYDLHRKAAVRSLLGSKVDRLMESSSLVTAGNEYLAERAHAAGAQRVEIVPTVVDMKRYACKSASDYKSDPVIGWIGSPSTWREYMVPLIPTLAEIAKLENARIHAVGGEASGDALVDTIPWVESEEATRLRSMDIGIMPLTDTPWSRGKCGYKLIQYMASGLPVVASPVGVNAEIVEDGVNGFLASSPAEWREALTVLLRDPDLRHKMGVEGRKKVEKQYSLSVWGPKVACLLKQVMG
ncbi:glycosyltransferase [Erythrobacter sp. 3-20A1M]|uniref:glycosyltransferase family 4 protein n=1 Tax=Erythrobacter sp. 3-20A1M TaxID=2653850 RepID=UPI001BFC04EA|nr:glycosyltransferase family 4 protein [Erythrobacter sp. 3-20A1M]QWC57959.1 glycosyltransferase [Erythrobacter sp. 3-20A1M]